MAFGKGRCLLVAVILLGLQLSKAMKENGGVEDTPCDWPTGQQYWPHPTNCHMFVQCTSYGPQEMHCAPGTTWTQSLLACDFKLNTGCGEYQPTSPPKAISTSPPKEPSTAPSTENKETSIACEGSELNISCEAGNLINLISVNYGRTAIGQDVCNSHHDTSNTNCKSSTSMEEVAERCNGKVSCSVGASNAVFGDPCQGTYKYLEVDYTCEPQHLQEIDFESIGGEAKATSFWNNNWQPMNAFINNSQGWHTGRDTSLPQVLWFEFTDAQSIKRFSFQSRPVGNGAGPVPYGPSKYIFWGSNGNDCSIESTWDILSEDYSGTVFDEKNTPKEQAINNSNSYKCYGFQVLKSQYNHPYAIISNVKMQATRANL